jgi:DNA-directed RNA polymerase specialized sigma subunit
VAFAALEVETKLINGERKTRDEAVVENIKLAQKVAARFEAKAKLVGLDYGDLVSLGAIGLMKAFDDFDDTLGYRFSTYAVPKIMGEMTRTIAKTNMGLHYPTDVRRFADIIQKQELEEYSIEEIARILGTNSGRAKYALEYLTQGMPSSLDILIFGKDETESSTFSELIGTDYDFSSANVKEFLETLSDREKGMVFHLLSGKSIQEVGKVYGVARAAINYHVETIQMKWALYQYGIPVKKPKRKVLEQLISKEIPSQFRTLKSERRYRISR